MITFPEGFIGIRGFSGYFWNSEDRKLYSSKIDGVLKPLKPTIITDKLSRKIYYGSKGKVDFFPGMIVYSVSVSGKRKYLTEKKIWKLLDFEYIIPVRK